MCKAVNLRSEGYDIYIGRAGRGKSGEFGNPFVVGRDGEHGECVRLFAAWFHSDEGASMRALVDARIKKGDRLGCFCKPSACHGDIIAAYVNSK